MKKTGLAKESAQKDHLLKDWKIVHGIWKNIKAILDLKSRIIWNTSLTDLSGSMSELTSWQDLDLTAYSSAKAKGVIINFTYRRLLGNGVNVAPEVYFRKNGSTVAYHAKVESTWDNRSGGSLTFYSSAQVWCPCDTGQVIEWKVAPDTNTLIDEFYVVGYRE